MPLTLPQQHPDAYSAYHLYVVRLHDASRRRAVFDALRQDGIDKVLQGHTDVKEVLAASNN